MNTKVAWPLKRATSLLSFMFHFITPFKCQASSMFPHFAFEIDCSDPYFSTMELFQITNICCSQPGVKRRAFCCIVTRGIKKEVLAK